MRTGCGERPGPRRRKAPNGEAQDGGDEPRLLVVRENREERPDHRGNRSEAQAFGGDAAARELGELQPARFRVTAGGDTFEMGPEAWLRLDAHEPHSLLALEPARLLLTMLPGAGG